MRDKRTIIESVVTRESYLPGDNSAIICNQMLTLEVLLDIRELLAAKPPQKETATEETIRITL